MTAPRREGPSIALALGGGGARGLAHIHAIEALDELGIRPVAIAGSSIGAIIGAGLAAGMSGADIREHAKSILANRGEVVRRIWQSRPGSLKEAVAGGIRLGQFDISRILRSFMPQTVPDTFEQLSIPLMVTGTDFYAHQQQVMDSGDLVSAVAASAAIPAVFRPVERGGRLLVDGGFYNPVPFDLLEGRADIVVAIDVVGFPEECGRAPSSFELMYGSSQLMMQSIIASKLAVRPPEVFLQAPVSKYRVLDFLKFEQIMSETASFRDEVKRAVDAAFAARAKG